MKTWEYLVIGKTGKIIASDRLNEYGDMGWELVTVEIGYTTLLGTANRPTRFYIFKRPQNK